MTDFQIIELIEQRREDKAMRKLYRYQGIVKKMILSKGGNSDDALDVFQDALIILCKNVWRGDFELKSKLDTYIYGISYNLWRDNLKSQKLDFSDEPTENFPIDDGLEDLINKEKKIASIEDVLQKIGEACLKLIKLFYYEKKKIKEIVQILNYSSENTVKVQKYKCIERAKNMIEI